MSATQYRIFNQLDAIAQGWYWLLPSHKLKRGKVKAVNIVGYELAVFRGKDGTVAALDAYCPHMGAHLAEGKVEGNQLRCFFHNWRFDANGQCTDIPCLDQKLHGRVSTKNWHISERYGLIWGWLGKGEPTEQIPEVSALCDTEYEYSLGNHFIKDCHPNVVMVNAIDEQHFQSVHHLPGYILTMEPRPSSSKSIEFRNIGHLPKTNLLGRLLSRFYKDTLTYNLDYWYGSVGTVTFGPDFLNLHLMFALRLIPDGRTEGRTIVFTRKRRGPLGWAFNRLVLGLTKVGGLYFSIGDTRIFRTIQFDLKTPIPADRAIVSFVEHLEQQNFYPVNSNTYREAVHAEFPS